MAVTAAELMVKISASGVSETKDELAGVSRESGNASGGIGGLLSTMTGFIGGAAIVNLAGDAFNFLKGQVVDSFHAGLDANNVLAQTVAGLKSTNDVSGMTAKSVGDLATHIMNLSGINDEATQTAENMLLTFTNIGKKVFPDATQAVADMSTKMNGGAIPSAQQMQQTSILLGKALNDPLHGITALTRVGVTFDDQQKAQIKTMMAHNDIAGAQGVVLKEINKEFGGAAAAAGQANGGISILTAQFHSLQENLGQQLIPILAQVLSALTPLTGVLMGDLSSAIAGITPLFANLKQTLAGLPMGQTVSQFQSLAKTGEAVGQRIEAAALPVLKQLGDFFTGHLLPAFNQFVGFANSTLLPMFGDIAVFVLQTIVPAVLQLASYWTDTLMPAQEQMVTWMRANVLPVFEALIKVIVTDVLPTVESLATTILTKVVPPMERLIGLLLPVLIPAFRLIGWVIQNIVGPVLGWLFGLLGDGISRIADFVASVEGDLSRGWAIVSTFFDNMGRGVQKLTTLFSTAGHDIIQGLINGIKGMLGDAVGAIKDVGNNMLSGIKGMFGIHSPSTVFADLGANLSRGLINGVTGVDVAGPIGAHLAGAIPALAGNVSVGMSGSLLGAAGASYGATIASAAGGARAQQSTFVIQLDGCTIARNTIEHMPGLVQVGTGLRG